MKLKKALTLALAAVMCIGTLAGMPTNTSAAWYDTIFHPYMEADEYILVQPGWTTVFSVNAWIGEGEDDYYIDDAEGVITDVVISSGSDVIQIEDWNSEGVEYTALKEGKAVMTVYYDLPEEYADSEDAGNGCLNVNILCAPFTAYFEMCPPRTGMRS